MDPVEFVSVKVKFLSATDQEGLDCLELCETVVTVLQNLATNDLEASST